MAQEDKTKDHFQAAFSIWVVLLGLLYLAYPDKFRDFFLISLLSWLLVLGLFAVIRKRKFGYIFKAIYEKSIVKKLGKMSAHEFEDFVADLYGKLGYRAERVSGAEFGGIDILVSGIDGEYYLVCRNRIGSDISLEEVEEFYQVLLRHRSSGKMITTGHFGNEASVFANGKAMELVDGKALLKLIMRINNKLKIK